MNSIVNDAVLIKYYEDHQNSSSTKLVANLRLIYTNLQQEGLSAQEAQNLIESTRNVADIFEDGDKTKANDIYREYLFKEGLNTNDKVAVNNLDDELAIIRNLCVNDEIKSLAIDAILGQTLSYPKSNSDVLEFLDKNFKNAKTNSKYHCLDMAEVLTETPHTLN